MIDLSTNFELTFSNADVNSICQEAGMLAVRDNRYMVTGKGKNYQDMVALFTRAAFSADEGLEIRQGKL